MDDRLRQLLESKQSDPLVLDCLDRIKRQGEYRYCKTSPLLIADVARVCSVRAAINKGRDVSRTEGFDELLSSLKGADGQTIEVHSIELKSVWFTILTDQSIESLFGILRSPKEQAKWFEQ